MLVTTDTSVLKMRIRNLEDDNERKKMIIQEQEKALLHWRKAYDELVAKMERDTRAISGLCSLGSLPPTSFRSWLLTP